MSQHQCLAQTSSSADDLLVENQPVVSLVLLQSPGQFLSLLATLESFSHPTSELTNCMAMQDGSVQTQQGSFGPQIRSTTPSLCLLLQMTLISPQVESLLLLLSLALSFLLARNTRVQESSFRLRVFLIVASSSLVVVLVLQMIFNVILMPHKYYHYFS